MANQMIVNLNDIYQYEQNAKTEYEKCEQEVAQLIEEIMVQHIKIYIKYDDKIVKCNNVGYRLKISDMIYLNKTFNNI